MNPVSSYVHNLPTSSHPQRMPDHKHKKNDLARRMLHDHKFMIERVKFLQAENSRLLKQLTLSQERQSHLKAQFDNYRKNERILTNEIIQHIGQIPRPSPFFVEEGSFQALSQIPANYSVSVDLSDIAQMLCKETPSSQRSTQTEWEAQMRPEKPKSVSETKSEKRTEEIQMEESDGRSSKNSNEFQCIFGDTVD